MKKKCLKLALAAAFAFFGLLLASPEKTYAETDNVNEKIYLEDIDVTDMTDEEIQQVIDAKMMEYATTTIDLDVYGTNVSVIAGELGLYRTNTDLIDSIKARRIKGNVLQRFAQEKHYEKNGPEFLGIDLAGTHDACYAVVSERCTFTDEDPVDMTLVLNEVGALVPTEKKDGHYVQVEESANKLMNFLENEWHGGRSMVVLPINVVPGYGTVEQFKECTSVLGTGITYYVDNGMDRNTNLMIGVGKINGCVVYPGETFSVLDHLAPFTEEAGYKEATVFLNGKVIDDIGGGACQVSTTLYHAVLYAELEVVERSAHSMKTVYCEPSMDAAVAEGTKDFVFRNNTDSPIYIAGRVGNGEIKFEIYGHETRDPNRTVEYESVVTHEEPKTTVFELSYDSEFGMVEWEDGFDGTDAALYKVVKINGEEVERTKINSSNYMMSPNTWVIGIKNATSKQISALAEAAATENVDNVYDTLLTLY